MQVDKVDEERAIQSLIPGMNKISISIGFVCFFFRIEICIDESIKKTFSVLSFMTNYCMVQKIADKKV
jgi:hypothetical protein